MPLQGTYKENSGDTSKWVSERTFGWNSEETLGGIDVNLWWASWVAYKIDEFKTFSYKHILKTYFELVVDHRRELPGTWVLLRCHSFSPIILEIYDCFVWVGSYCCWQKIRRPFKPLLDPWQVLENSWHVRLLAVLSITCKIYRQISKAFAAFQLILDIPNWFLRVS